MANALDELMSSAGFSLAASVGSTPRAKLIYQADQMLQKLSTMKNASELNYEGSNTLWWAGSASGDKRVVSMYYGSKVVADRKYDAENSIKGVTSCISQLRKAFDQLPEEWFDAEETRRENESAKRSKK